jgi:hypothetical protein
MGGTCCKVVWCPQNYTANRCFPPKRSKKSDHDIHSLALATAYEEPPSPIAADFVLGSSAHTPGNVRVLSPSRTKPSSRARSFALPHMPIRTRTPRSSQPDTPRSIAMPDPAFSFADFARSSHLRPSERTPREQAAQAAAADLGVGAPSCAGRQGMGSYRAWFRLR